MENFWDLGFGCRFFLWEVFVCISFNTKVSSKIVNKLLLVFILLLLLVGDSVGVGVGGDSVGVCSLDTRS